jgi:uncharacterized OB-fold protein
MSDSTTRTTATDEILEFRRRLAHGQMCLQRCDACRTEHFPPGPACWQCGSQELTWLEMSDGAGVVRSLTVCHSSFMRFADEVPYTVVIGDLTAHPGVRVLARFDAADRPLTIGDHVVLDWSAAEGEVRRYRWRDVQEPDKAR